MTVEEQIEALKKTIAEESQHVPPTHFETWEQWSTLLASGGVEADTQTPTVKIGGRDQRAYKRDWTSHLDPSRSSDRPTCQFLPKTEQLAESAPAVDIGDAAPEGPGTPEYKPLMRKPRGARCAPSAIGLLPGHFWRN